MATRLTAFSKFFITLVILGVIGGGGYYMLKKTTWGQNLEKKAEAQKSETGSEETPKTGFKDDENTLVVQLVTWGGYGPGLYFNEGAEPNEQSRFFKEYGFKVRFVVENDLINAMNAWIADEYDVAVQTADAFPLYTGPEDINQYKPKAFMQVDWSRGGDAIIVKRGINSVNDLKGKKVVVAVPSPAQTLLMTALEAANLKYSDVEVIKTTDNLKAAQLFRSADVDAAVVWSPDDILATNDVPGSKILLTTKDQSHVIADIFFAKESYLNANRKMIDGFYEGWMKAVAELKANPSNKDKAAKYVAELFQVGVPDAMGMMDVVYWTGHGDNVNFFGMNPEYRGQRGEDLYTKMSKNFVVTGDAENEAPAWRSAIFTGAVQAGNAKLTGPAYSAEASKTFTAPTASAKTAPAIASKPVSINFASGKFQLDENSKTIIDLQFADVSKSFANARVRIEGNTDNVGSKQLNAELSRKRAQAVADYLASQYKIDKNRFVIIGNGPDKPVAGCEQNQNEACKAKNRRTEFQLISD
ncbi:MAG TPA: phosphate ABC transporter substrate-binding/OmpA family protein [Saprospiraceae bacterium]|nr:phosphate ABC transporter substrate-binding/OmpA family protein [Saprospiraceae bacterium]HQW26053.1 phosphate ABC transporter substrate-binding/OmpA family protein [Saprospiraceae bacterium]